MQTSERLINGWKVKYAAQDGIQIFLENINDNSALEEMILNANGKSVEAVHLDEQDEKASCTVYAKRKDGKIIALSVARKKDVSRRVIGYYQKMLNGRYTIERLEY